LPTQVSLLTLTHGPMSLAFMVSEPASHLLAVGSGRATIIFFILAADTDTWACHYFLNEICFPKLLEPIKQHLKIIKIQKIRIWTFSISIKYQQSHLCAQNSYISFLHHRVIIYNSYNIKFALKIYKLTW
jgi:hypothetical protein